MRILLLSFGTLVAALSSAPALAGDAECVWNHLPLGARQSVFAVYERGGADALDQAQIEDPAVVASFRACTHNSSATPYAAIGPALVGVSLEHAAMNHLKVVERVNPAPLEQAWRGLTAAERQSLRAAFLASNADIPKATFAALDRAVVLAGYKLALGAHVVGDARYRHHAEFFEGRAQKEAYEQRF